MIRIEYWFLYGLVSSFLLCMSFYDSVSNLDEMLGEQLCNFILLIVNVLSLVSQSPNFLLKSTHTLVESFLDGPPIDKLDNFSDLTFIDLACVTVRGEQGRA